MSRRRQVKLSTQQYECIKYPPRNDLLIRGIPGSGKTTVLLERARWLKEQGEKDILLLTYSSMLAQFVRELSLKTPGEPVEARTFHSWGLQLLRDVGRAPSRGVAANEEQFEKIKYAFNTVNKYRADLSMPSFDGGFREKIEFLREEFSWIKGLGKDRSRYMNEPRTGRGSGVQVTKEDKAWIWQVFETYQSMMRDSNYIDFDDVPLLLLEFSGRLLQQVGPAHILVDEGQDLSAMQLRAIRAITRKTLTIAADKGQSIYKRNFSWAELGIDIRGRSRSLTQTFRSTRQITKLAASLQRYDPLALKKDGELVPIVESDNDGPLPEVFIASSLKQQAGPVAEWLEKKIAAFPDDSIGVVIPGKSQREMFEEELNARGIPYCLLKQEENPELLSPGVKLVTYHAAKGLEFDHVAVTCLRDGTMPHCPDPNLAEDERQEFLATERRKVYVAITRAMFTLAIFSTAKSQFVDEMDQDLYRVR